MYRHKFICLLFVSDTQIFFKRIILTLSILHNIQAKVRRKDYPMEGVFLTESENLFIL